jgi:hypothetical protein
MNATGVEQAILDRLAHGVHQRLQNLPPEEADSIDPTWVADAMLESIPTEHPFVGLGPFYDTAGLIRWLGITRQAVHQKVRAHQLLACETGDGRRVYPAWQFTPDGRTIPGFTAVLQTMLAATDPWTAAIWLTTPSDRLGGRSAIDVLRSEHDPEPVLVVARADATRWAA